ncbi:SAM-dependent methyltransferase [Geobacter sulfurreducens]|nr:SAM-dependent methyltransferase [Geobacter sulfurreducens]
MILDPTNQYIATIISQCDGSGKEILEIGCGKGRITRDLAKHAKRVVATDPDAAALEKARATITADNVEFMHAPTGMPDFPAETFDMVIYTLSFHHVPIADMSSSLRRAASLIRESGAIVIVEPGDGGSFTEAKERFGAGSGDERPAREAAVRALHALEGWIAGETVHFRTLFQFNDAEDFFTSLLPDYRQQPEAFIREVRSFLEQHRTADGIILEADRRLNVLRRAGSGQEQK